MEPLISEMLGNFERGRLSRRQLVEGLAALALASSAATLAGPARAETAEPLPVTNVDHVSILVADLEKSVGFYETVFGLENVSEDKEHKIVRLAPKGARHAVVSLRQEPPAGRVDHYALRLPDFDPDKTTAQLKKHGLTAARNLEYGYYIRDLDGMVVQIV